MDAREEILGRLKKAVHPTPEVVDFDSPIYPAMDEPVDVAFKKNLELVNGHAHLCNTEEDVFTQIHSLLSAYEPETICCKDENLVQQLHSYKINFSECDKLPVNLEVGILPCEFLVAHTGSIMVSSAQKGGREFLIYPPVHIFIARKTQLVKWLDDAYQEIQKKYTKNLPSQITLITGPSRTADIEKTLVMGAHGPKEVHVFVY